MNCTKCGEQIKKGEISCSACDFPVKQMLKSMKKSRHQRTVHTSEPTKDKVPLAAVIGVCGVLAVIGVILFIVIGNIGNGNNPPLPVPVNSPEPTPEPTPSPTPTPQPTPTPTPEPTPEPTEPPEEPQEEIPVFIELQFPLDRHMFTRNGEMIEADTAPFLRGNTALLPLRTFADITGAEFTWVRGADVAVITLDGEMIQIRANEPLPNNMGTPIMSAGFFFIPFRYAAYLMDAELFFDVEARVIYLRYYEIPGGGMR